MIRIEKVFVDIGKMKTQTNPHLVKMGIDGPTTTGLVNRQLGLILKLNPAMLKEEEVPL